tara:strand:- start:328 stop:540 length:213 start_codon:yes stop_codon:yes gene_type:complete
VVVAVEHLHLPCLHLWEQVSQVDLAEVGEEQTLIPLTQVEQALLVKVIMVELEALVQVMLVVEVVVEQVQ